MDATLHQLGGILLKAVATLVLLVLLHLYLKAVFFRPLQNVLAKRKEVTAGARAAAEAALQKVTVRSTEYDAKLKDARADIYREQEQMRKRWLDEQTQHLEEARQKTHGLIQVARQELDRSVEAAKRDLSVTAHDLAEDISNRLLGRRAG